MSSVCKTAKCYIFEWTEKVREVAGILKVNSLQKANVHYLEGMLSRVGLHFVGERGPAKEWVRVDGRVSTCLLQRGQNQGNEDSCWGMLALLLVYGPNRIWVESLAFQFCLCPGGGAGRRWNSIWWLFDLKEVKRGGAESWQRNETLVGAVRKDLRHDEARFRKKEVDISLRTSHCRIQWRALVCGEGSLIGG